jgi:hypothetical protein
MATVKMMQGDSRSLSLQLKVDGKTLIPSMVSEIEVTVGEYIRKLHSNGEVLYDSSDQQWHFVLTQEETLAIEPNGYEVQARIKLQNGQHSPVTGISVGRIIIISSQSKEVI